MTPNIDRLAAQSVCYTNAYAPAPVCSPARSCLITGVYASSLGTENLRSTFPIPEFIKGFPTYLRDAGYYCTNNVKTDYNTSNEPAIIKASWDECSATAHWRSRKAGQPFFSVFNCMTSHQGPSTVVPYEQFEKEVRQKLEPGERHDPAKAPVPPYWPDTPITRRTLARVYDCITAMDKEHVGNLLKELDEDGLAENTIVFFYSDGGAGMPRHKRLVLDSGLHVPLLIRFPKKFQTLAPARPGETVDRLVSFVDFPPTVLSLVGLPIPGYMQGQAFLGQAAAAPREHVFGARDRVDEAIDLARSVRDKRYLYVRNYMPHVSYNQPEGYSDQAEVRREITRLAAEGKLDAVQMAYAGPTKALEELYDSQNDPLQIRNLAESSEHRPILERMRKLHRQWVFETRDLGFLPETDRWERSRGTTPYHMAKEPEKYSPARVLEAAEWVGHRDALDKQVKLLADSDSAVRYWAAVGLRALGKGAASAREALVKALRDSAAAVRIEAAGALAALEQSKEALAALTESLRSEQLDEAEHAARTLQMLGEKARPAFPAMKAALERSKQMDPNHGMYIGFALEAALGK
jgi:arylsulfatase A-like enzyme